MTHDVMIKVTGVQAGFGDGEPMEMTTPGQYYERNGKMYIRYIDSVLDEEEDAATTIKVDGETVSIIRSGAVGSHLHFEKGKTHYSPYETPFGTFDMLLATRDIQLAVSDELIRLEVDYFLEINKAEASESKIEIEVRPSRPLPERMQQ